MPIDTQHYPVEPEALARKHESRNPPIGRILLTAASVVLMMALCQGIVWRMMRDLARKRPLDPTAEARGIVTAPNLEMLKRFPAPHLQINPHDDLAAWRARQDAELSTYGWVDRSNGIVRIPIERAMDLTLARGLPVRSSNAPAATGKSSLELIRERAPGP
jgi:hypothetical protein